MGRSTKWIDSQPDDSVEVVARRALEARLERLWHFLELSVSQPASETENVHQLRVSARRTAAAMEIFADWLPPRRGRWVRKQMKRVRKAAGEARDLDVLRMRWTDRVHEMPAGEGSLLLEQVKRRRRKAQRPIEEAYRRFVRKKFEQRATTFVERVRLRGEETATCDQRLGCLARVALGRLVVPYLQAARAELADALWASLPEDQLGLSLDDAVRRAWAKEAKRRMLDVEAGKLELLPGDEVMARLRTRAEE